MANIYCTKEESKKIDKLLFKCDIHALLRKVRWVIYGRLVSEIRDWTIAIWFIRLIFRCSYNEVISKFENMSDNRRWDFEDCLDAILHYRGLYPKADVRCDEIIQMTYGLSNMVDLYNYVKNYNEMLDNETSEEESA